MRALDENETTQVFTKLFKFTGNNLKNLIETPSHEGPDPEPTRYCFRLQKNRVYYVSESLVKRATNVKREKLVSFGTQIGKLTKNGSFHLTIHCLGLLAANSKHKIGKLTKNESFHLTIHCLGLLAANSKHKEREACFFRYTDWEINEKWELSLFGPFGCQHKVWIKPTSEQSFTYGNHVLKGGLGRITESISPGDGVVIFSMNDVPLGFGIAAKSTGDCRKMDPNGIVVLHQADIGMYLREEDDM